MDNTRFYNQLASAYKLKDAIKNLRETLDNVDPIFKDFVKNYESPLRTLEDDTRLQNKIDALESQLR